MKELIFSLNTVCPLILLVALGFIIKKLGILPKEFFTSAEKLVFKIALPCSLFLSVSRADPYQTFSPRLIIFVVIGTVTAVLAVGLITTIFLKKNEERGAFIQGSYRSNFALLGTPLAQRLFPETGGAVASSLMPFTIPLFNIIAVIVLSLFAPMDKRLTPGQICKKTVKGIVTNPLIIGIVLALPFMLLRITLPTIASATLGYVGGLASPLALICIGASIADGMEIQKLGKAFASAALKVVIIPVIAVFVAVLLGFRDVELGMILITFGSPMAVTGYIMAKNMGSDEKLAGQILLISTVACAFTLFAGIYILTSFRLIPMT